MSTVGFVSMDTEGTGRAVLRGFDLTRWRPRLLVMENNDDGAEVDLYLGGFSYRKLFRHVVNDFYLNVAMRARP